MSDSLGDVLGRFPRNSLGTRRVKILATSGTSLTVQLPDGASVPAQGILGLTYTVGAYGVAFVQEKAIPIVFPV